MGLTHDSRGVAFEKTVAYEGVEGFYGSVPSFRGSGTMAEFDEIFESLDDLRTGNAKLP